MSDARISIDLKSSQLTSLSVPLISHNPSLVLRLHPAPAAEAVREAAAGAAPDGVSELIARFFSVSLFFV